MGRDPNVGHKAFMNRSLTQVKPSLLWLSLIQLGINFPIFCSLFFEKQLLAPEIRKAKCLQSACHLNLVIAFYLRFCGQSTVL